MELVLPKVVIVLLRQPTNKATEMRSDPFWEFGSFGATGCHRKNLMNPAKADELKGARLAFAQGGTAEIRLVYLSPPITIHRSCGSNELCVAQWPQPTMPFRYSCAPLLIDNDGHSDFPGIKELIQKVHRSTWVAQFASKFRSRRRPLEADAARQLVTVLDQLELPKASRCQTYEQALPYPPPKIDRERKRTYDRLLERLS